MFALRAQADRMSALHPFLMLEVPNARKDHCQTILIRRGDHFGIADGSAGLNDCGNSMLGGFVKSVTEREESI